jgi:hypothetical protein
MVGTTTRRSDDAHRVDQASEAGRTGDLGRGYRPSQAGGRSPCALPRAVLRHKVVPSTDIAKALTGFQNEINFTDRAPSLSP